MDQPHIADLLAGFGSFTFIPVPFTFSSNNWNPKLILHSDHVEYRGGFFTRKMGYTNIQQIDIYIKGKRTKNLIIYPMTGFRTFIGNFRQEEQLQDFLHLFQQKGCSLSEKAKYFLMN